MIAKAISHGRQAINYALREGKFGGFIASNMIESLTPDEILKEFEVVRRYNERCRNKFPRVEIGITPQDEAKHSKHRKSGKNLGRARCLITIGKILIRNNVLRIMRIYNNLKHQHPSSEDCSTCLHQHLITTRKN
ncbi:MAG: hypothetical protein LBP56_10875 [Odoribacteraceae bacterium]|jgi:hypothetical protein|nr:hypothetical protein [Odoribacteraceae bacterium]